MKNDIITFAEKEIANINFTVMKINFSEDVDIENMLPFDKVSSDEKTINTLLVTWKMIIKVNHSA